MTSIITTEGDEGLVIANIFGLARGSSDGCIQVMTVHTPFITLGNYAAWRHTEISDKLYMYPYKGKVRNMWKCRNIMPLEDKTNSSCLNKIQFSKYLEKN